MSQQPAVYINLEIYEDGRNLLGVAKVQLPPITYPCVTISGAGMMGIDFLTTTEEAVRLAAPTKHQLDMRVAEEFWEVETAEVDIWADKFVVICRPKEIAPGTVAPMATADTKGTFAVYYYAAYKNGKQLWEIDKRNMKCVINGVDHMAPVRKALGK